MFTAAPESKVCFITVWGSEAIRNKINLLNLLSIFKESRNPQMLINAPEPQPQT